MSAIIVLPVLIPAVSAAWPMLLAAAGAAASAMGYAAAQARTKGENLTEVNLELENSEAVAGDAAFGEQVVFTKGDIQIVFFRNTSGKVSVKALGRNKSEAELRKVALEFANGVTQQYAYHRLMTELRQRNFSVVGQEVEKDGTVRLQVRTFRD